MTESPLYLEISSLLAQEEMRALMKAVNSRYVPWEEFRRHPLPDGISPEALWDLFASMQRAQGIEVPIPDLFGRDYWYHRTHEMVDALSRVQCMCRADSDLYRRLTMTQNRSVLVRSRIDETIAAALFDGLDIDDADVEGVLQLDRTPRTDTERLVRNNLTVLDDLNSLIGVPFSRDLFMHLRYLLLEGVDVTRLRAQERRQGLVPPENETRDVLAASERQLEYISAYMNHESGDVHDHPVMRALLVPDLFRYYRPLPDSNSEVGRLAFRLYALKAGLPVLGLLPLWRAKLNWEEGRLDTSIVSVQPEVYRSARMASPTTMTAYHTASLQLALVALQDLQWSLRELEQRDEELRSLLQRDPEINHRQRSILGRALRNPTAEFRIAHHKNTHNIVYATARADLLELVDKNLLVLGKNGRAMVFTPRPHLRQFIEEQYQVE